MHRRLLAPLLPLALVVGLAVPVIAQTLGFDVMNTRREISGRMWGSGHLVLFCVEENEANDYNEDGDARDAGLFVGDLRSLTTTSTGIAVSYNLTDNERDWPAAAAPELGLVAVQWSEAENGEKDVNNNGRATDDVLCIYNVATKQKTWLGSGGSQPTWSGGKLYFAQPESPVGRDLNGDGDLRDFVLCFYDPKTGQVQSLGAECSTGFRVAGDWAATMTSEAGQGNRDLNFDRDANDRVVQLYQLSARRWLNTGLESAYEPEVQIRLTPKLCAIGTNEANQGGKDLNGDGDVSDCVLQVVTLPANGSDPLQTFNSAQDCSGGIQAHDNLTAIITSEKAQHKRDLNGDKDAEDDVVQTFTLGAQAIQDTGLEGAEGIYLSAGKVAVPVSEASQSDRDLNGDKDVDDYVLHLYDAVRNKISNTKVTVEQALLGNEGTLIWRVSEMDQADRDLNRDMDTDDSIVAVMDMATGHWSVTGYATMLSEMWPVARGCVFALSEMDQGGRDINNDGEMDDDVVVMLRKK